MHGLRELRRRKHHRDHDPAGLAVHRATEDPQPVVVQGRCPPGRARIEVDSGGRVADGIERAGVPARPWADVLGNLAGEEEVEVSPAESWLGDSLDLLQDPRAQIGVRCGTGADSLPWPGEPDTRQVQVDAHQVQGCRQGDQHYRPDRPAKYEAHRNHDGGPLDPAHDAAAMRAGIVTNPARPRRPGAAARTGLPWWRRSGLTWPGGA